MGETRFLPCLHFHRFHYPWFRPRLVGIPLSDLDYEKVKDVIVWRAVASRTLSGGMNWFHTEYLHEDYILTTHFGEYMQEIESRSNVEKITLHRLGPFKDVFNSERKQRAGTTSIAKERKIVKLESFL